MWLDRVTDRQIDIDIATGRQTDVIDVFVSLATSTCAGEPLFSEETV